MKTTKQRLATAIISALFSGSVLADLVSLRGDTPLDEASVTPLIQRMQADHSPDAREYIQQPPLIPHRIQGYKINLKFNKCLTCHSWANYRTKGATKISSSHFNDRDGKALANISGQRYFCTLCHVPQVDVPVLIGNTFKSIQAMREN